MKSPDLHKREQHNLWITILIALFFALINLSADFIERVKAVLETYGATAPVRIASNFIFLWVTGVLWIAYTRWRRATVRQTELENIVNSISPDTFLVVSEADRIVSCNDSSLRMFGYRPDEVINTSASILYEAEHTENEMNGEGFRRVITTGKRRDGSTFPLEVIRGDLRGGGGAVLLLRDITEREAAAKELAAHQEHLEELVKKRTHELEKANRKLQEEMNEHQRAEANYHAVFNGINDAIFVHDLETGVILDVNEKMCEMYKCTPETARKLTVGDISSGTPPYSQDDAIQWVKKAASGSPQLFEWHARDVDGTLFWVEVNLKCATIAGTERLLAIVRDVTQRKRNEEELQDANIRLQQTLAELEQTQENMLHQERLRVVGQMASGVAHDINNALQPVLGYSDLLLSRPHLMDDRPKLEGYLRKISTAAEDATRVVTHLYQFGRKDAASGERSPINVNELAEQSVSLTQHKWKSLAQAQGRTIEVQTKLAALPPILGNAVELREVLTNLILNATDAMTEGGTITISTTVDEEDIVLAVADTGTGMSEEVRGHCMDPFFSTKASQGAGLGLWMTAWIVKRFDGTISVETEEGRGTTMLIRLPITDQLKNDSEPSVTGSPCPSLRILVVDDDDQVRELLMECLVMEGHSVESTSDGTKGLSAFKAGEFDMVITDQAMPSLSGEKLALAIKEQAPETPIILLTGFGDMYESSREKPEAIDLVVTKPINPDQLLEMIAGVWKTRETKNDENEGKGGGE
ncbi:PAS domain S-box protein [Planctomycetota bacterium]